MRSDEFQEKYRGTRTALVGDLVVEFIYGVGIMTYAVNIFRPNTHEFVQLNQTEWETLITHGAEIRKRASEHDGDRQRWPQ